MLLALLGLTLSTPPDAPSEHRLDRRSRTFGDRRNDSQGARGIIESVSPDRGVDPPGVVSLKLTERPSRISGGCLRGKWTAIFQLEPGAAERTAVFSDAYMSKEVSLLTVSDCSKGEFAHVNPVWMLKRR